MVFLVSLAYSFACTVYFDVDKSSILYCGCFFMTGWMIYLYGEAIAENVDKGIARWIYCDDYSGRDISVCGYYAKNYASN